MDEPAQEVQPRGRPFQVGDDPRRNAGGRPAGYSVRAAWRRRLAAEQDEEGIGKLARGLAEQLEKAVARGDMKAVRALAIAIAEAEGKPQERIEHSGTTTINAIFDADAREPETP